MQQGQNVNAVSDSDRPESFQLKGGLFPMSLLELRSSDLQHIAQELQSKVQKSPGFFKRSAVVIGLDQLNTESCENLDLFRLTQLCKHLELIPTAIRGGPDSLTEQAFQLGLAVLPKGKSNKSRAIEIPEPAPQAAPAQQEPSTPTQQEATAEQSQPLTGEEQGQAQEPVQEQIQAAPTNRVVTSPIRSGQQIYARGGDLIILTSVSAGAEVLADGNIHVYGPLRGRALAGVMGDTNARIFCSSQEAELVSVAGHFLVDETLKSTHWKKPVQIFIHDGRLITSPLE